MKRVLFFIDSFPNYSETFLYNQIYYLLDSGFYVDVIAIKQKVYSKKVIHQKMMDYKLNEHVSFLRHGLKNRLLVNILLFPIFSFKLLLHNKFRRSLFFIQNIDLFECFKNHDIVHAHYGHIGAMVGDLRKIGLFKSQKLICSFHGEELLPIYLDSYQSRYSNMLEYFDAITANSYYVKDLILKSLRGSESITSILPESLDTGYFRLLDDEVVKCDRFSILFVGRLIEWKAPIIAIQIVEMLLNLKYSVHLDIIGSGPEYDRCIKYISENNLKEYIVLHGSLSQEEIKGFLEKSDVFLFPGIKEPSTGKAEAQGLVIQEAQAMNVPVIVSDAGGMKFGLMDGITGYVVPENDLEGFVQKIRDLIINVDRRTELGKNGRKFVIENFDIQVLGKKLLQIYSLN